ncbi:MAG TPA: DoxX family protein [bacterium]|nr:DoxX family protein [bacterium]
MTYALWIAQATLAVLFLFAGGVKLALPLDALTKQTSLPGWFLRFTGTAEMLGAMGLVLPGLLRIRPSLTPLAAAGLVIVMVGATAFTVVAGGGISALIPATVGLLAAFVGYGRWRLVPLAAHRRGRFQLVEA